MYYSKKTGLLWTPALTQKVVDRVGAGDALFALSAHAHAEDFLRTS
jgi:hypothetical protein